MTTGYYALDNPNPNATKKGYPGFWGYLTMNQVPRAVTLHSTESFADLDGPDTGAENVANWFQTNDTFALYHTLVDYDSILKVVPAGLDGTVVHTAFHAAGYNSFTLGVSMALRADSWPTLPEHYKTQVLRNAAKETAALLVRHNLPPILRTKAEIDAGAKGVTGHGILDPGYRSDPGAQFPWPRFMQYVLEYMKLGGDLAPSTREDPDMWRCFEAPDGNLYLVRNGKRKLVLDVLKEKDIASLGLTSAQWREYLTNLHAAGVLRDGLWTKVTWDTLLSFPAEA